MEKLSDKQLKYIQGNLDGRVARRAPVAVGQIAADLLRSEQMSGPAWRRRLVAVLSEHGQDLLEHASILGVRDGVLKLHVAEPALMYRLRVAWEQRLLALLRAQLPESGIHSIRFIAGPTPSG
ncbi:MAG TPA: DciA family protein [Phycisphaerae bacterium]|nr:DciA family protein [Phycisphaerae bacterium]HOJ72657.1 DciA family protein [Phycisphaerae bacterium]HOM49682.1 DciA family protein [Phycisphaerae bacterium]HON65181.1 DciA family protein [Phycisphaerae bacterium]HOQ85118.1 DciA family protein [Phycisphaerae bacterium]